MEQIKTFITIGDKYLAQFSDISISNSVDKLIDTATFKIPLTNGGKFLNEIKTELNYFENGDLSKPISKITNVKGKWLTIKSPTGKGGNISIRVGDAVRIHIYYSQGDSDIMTSNKIETLDYQFLGYITEFIPVNGMIKIVCEDSMSLFKNVVINQSWTKTTLIDVIDYIKDQILKYIDSSMTFPKPIFPISTENTILNMDIDILRIENIRAINVLELLAKRYGLFIYFQNSPPLFNIDEKVELYCNFKYPSTYDLQVAKYQHPYRKSPTEDNDRNLVIQNNTKHIFFDKENDLIVSGNKEISGNKKINSSNITLFTTDGINIKYVSEKINNAIKSILPNSTNISKEIYTLTKSSRKNQMNLNIKYTDINYLKEIILESWNNHPTDQLTGTITVPGEPIIKHGTVIDISIFYGAGLVSTDKTTFFNYIDEVTTNVNNKGFRQILKLGKRI